MAFQKRLFKALLHLLLASAAVWATPCQADVQSAVTWLSAQQSTTGEFFSPAPTATSTQATGESALALVRSGNGAQFNLAAAKEFLANDGRGDLSALALRIQVFDHAGLNTVSEINAILAQQNPDGGFGQSNGFQSSVLDSAEVIRALGNLNYPANSEIAGTIGYLLDQQRPDGSWALGENTSSVYVTSLVVSGLQHYKHAFGGIPQAIGGGVQYLLSQQGASGSWGETMDSAVALKALVEVLSDPEIADSAYASLLGEQQTDGSFSQSSYTTALVISALQGYVSRTSEPPIAAEGSVGGKIVMAGTGLPLEGVTVGIVGFDGASALTNASGQFLLSGVAGGGQTLRAVKSGYDSVVFATQVVEGAQVSVPDVVMRQSVDTGIVRGTIKDAMTGLQIAGASVQLNGFQTYSITSDSLGRFEITGVIPGDYSVVLEAPGYTTVVGSAHIPNGQILVVDQALVPNGAFLPSDPGTLSGTVVDAASGTSLSGVQLTLSSGETVVSDTNGQFRILDVPRGSYNLTATISGYVPQQYVVLFAPGSSGDLGVLPLNAAQDLPAASTLTLSGVVRDSVSRLAIPAASVTLAHSGETVQTDAAGQFEISGIDQLSFELSVSAGAYLSATYQLTADGFGTVSVELLLSPESGTPGATDSTIRGVVSNAVDGVPIVGATVSVNANSSVSSAGGEYSLSQIAELEFTVTAQADGFRTQTRSVQVGQFGTYQLNLALDPLPTGNFTVLSLSGPSTAVAGNSIATFDATVVNVDTVEKQALLVGEIFNSLGESVAQIAPVDVDGVTPKSLFDFPAQGQIEAALPWRSSQNGPGTYRLMLRVVEPGTITRANPFGEVLATASAYVDISESREIGGAMEVNPPVTQADFSSPITISAVVRNLGNVPLSADTYTLTISNLDSGAMLHEADINLDAMEVSEIQSVNLGDWLPTEAGNLQVRLAPKDATVGGDISVPLYIGDAATGTFSVDRAVVPVGDQAVRAIIAMQGVDVSRGSSTDPLFPVVKEAVRRGGQVVATEGPAWHTRNNCLGCHIQSQSLYGLASSQDKAEIDANATNFLYNAIAGSQQPDGTLRLSHPEFSLTQTLLGAWSLTSWQNKAESFGTLRKAVEYLQGRRRISGNSVFWGPDHASGWWYSFQGSTAIGMAAISDVLETARSGQLSKSFGNAITFGGNRNTQDLEFDANGDLWAIDYNGSLSRTNTQTGSTTMVATGLGSQMYGLALGADGTAYVSGYFGRLMKISPDGNRQLLLSGGGYLTDIEIGPDGNIYVADYSNNRILRVFPVGGWEVFASGTLFDRPWSIAFDSTGQMVVANMRRRNILAIDSSGQASIRLDNLPSMPIRVAYGADDSLYISTLSNSVYSWFNGQLTHEAWDYRIRGLEVGDQGVWIGNFDEKNIKQLKSDPPDTSRLAVYKETLIGNVHYFLNQYSSATNDTLVEAFRLYGLGEARPHIEDEALVQQIDTAMQVLDARLRSRQRSDGGWGKTTGHLSDSLVTAWVGLALDHLDPSPDDPQVRSAINYLLNHQASDGSWRSANGILTTNLGATSLVMAYLPKALERLGGIDVDLAVKIPANNLLSNPSVPATVIEPQSDGSVRYLWQLTGVTSTGREVAFDLNLLGMQLNESRPVALEAAMTFQNSFTDETVSVPLEIPEVKAVSELGIGLSLSQPSIGANSDLDMVTTVVNTSPVTAQGSADLTLMALDGETPILTLGSLQVVDLASGAAQVDTTTWNSGSTLAGDYLIRARLFDVSGSQVDEAFAPIAIESPIIVGGAQISSDRPTYDAWDAVILSGRVLNLSANTILDNTLMQVLVTDPVGTTLFSGEAQANTLMAGGLADREFYLTLTDAVPGAYQVTLTVLDLFSHAFVAEADTSFLVTKTTISALKGGVTTAYLSVFQGDANICHEQLINLGSTDLVDLELIHQLVDFESGELIASVPSTRDVAGHADTTTDRVIETGSLPVGTYACLLSANIDGATHQLGAAAFDVLEPPIRISSNYQIGAFGRLLVLIDAVPESGHDDTPTRQVQREFLEAFLTSKGWGYTLVDNDDDFGVALRTGQYSAYLLLSEDNKLDNQIQEELREAVFRGEGLVVAGIHDERNHGVDKALGVKLHGRESHAEQIEVAESELLTAGYLDMEATEKPMDVELEGASDVARFLDSNGDLVEGVDSHGQCDSQCESRHGSAVTLHEFGEGRAVYAAYDLLAEATQDGDQSRHAQLLHNALVAVQPESSSGLYRAIPVDLILTNEGMAVDGRVLTYLPDGVEVIDAGGAEWFEPGVLAIPYSLAEEAVTSWRLWLRFVAPGEPVLTSVIQTREGEEFEDYDSVQLQIVVPDPISVSQVTGHIDDYGSIPGVKLSDVRKALERAEDEWGRGKRNQALHELVKAIEPLEESQAPEAKQLRLMIDQLLREWSPGVPLKPGQDNGS